MKALRVLCFLLCALPLFSQGYPPVPESGDIWLDDNGNVTSGQGRYHLFFRFSYGGVGIKTLTYSVSDCDPPLVEKIFLYGFTFHIFDTCTPLGQSKVQNFSAVQLQILTLKQWANGLPYRIEYPHSAPGGLRRSLVTQQPVAPPNPTAIFLDGLGGNILQFDLLTGTVVSQVTPPGSAIGPLAVRPSVMSTADEVWVSNESSQVTVLNMSAQTVTANIPTPSVPSGATAAGIAFTNSGSIAFEAFQRSSPDSSGNRGLLVVFDAVNRAVTSTLPLKYGPVAFVMAPDGLTAYLLSEAGQITYYDVLSGTADLSASTYTPGFNYGYNGVSNVFIHPDGTRLFWAVGPYLESFDLTKRIVTATFNSGLPTTSAITLEVSQDGSIATMSNGQGAIVIMDTRYGIVQYNLQYDSASLFFPGN